MGQTYNRHQIAELMLDGNVRHLNRKAVTITLDGATFPGHTIAGTKTGVIVRFKTPGIYFGAKTVKIASPLYNNGTLHALERLEVH